MGQIESGKQPVTRRGKLAACASLALMLAACKGTVTTELAVELPADPGVRQVLASVTGLEFIGSGSTTQTLEFSDAESFELTSYAGGDTLRLFTDEELPEGNYTGVRLLFDAEAEANGTLVDAAGDQFPIIASEGDYAAIDVRIEDDENSSDSLTLTLDLRQSLTFNDDDDEYTVVPVLRSVQTGESGSIQGNVTGVCGSARLDTVAAVYLFQGSDIAPDDRDGSGIEPYATSPVLSSLSGAFSYVFRFLPPGDYTISLACRGNEEDPVADDALDFKDAANVSVDEDETLTHNI